jgi:hypothetical protein
VFELKVTFALSRNGLQGCLCSAAFGVALQRRPHSFSEQQNNYENKFLSDKNRKNALTGFER